ncbi:MAG TPA: M28 family peptidase [Gemmatimonadaceae bacterium]|nr:M28 family peptidase [Gemmatimonadaceae bacterium]
MTSPLSAEVNDARRLLEAIGSTHRFTGSEAETSAREKCAADLTEAGFEVSSHPFTFSEFPARWAPPLGAGLTMVLVSVTAFLASKPGGSVIGLGIVAGGLAAIGWAAARVARTGTSTIPWMRSASNNLVATRGRHRRDATSIWLVAHIDSKSQTIAMHVRIASVFASAMGIAGLFVGLVLGTFAQLAPSISAIAAMAELSADIVLVCFYVTLVSLLPLLVCLTGNKSDGSVDNASGVVAVLLAARRLDPLIPVGIVITSGEELALAGARAFVLSHAERGIALNCDTIDDDGRFIAMTSGRRQPRLSAAMGKAAERVGTTVSVTRMLPGVLADNVAFTDAGWESLTLSRGNLGTLARVHTSDDNLERFTGDAIVQASRLLAATVEELT